MQPGTQSATLTYYAKAQCCLSLPMRECLASPLKLRTSRHVKPRQFAKFRQQRGHNAGLESLCTVRSTGKRAYASSAAIALAVLPLVIGGTRAASAFCFLNAAWTQHKSLSTISSLPIGLVTLCPLARIDIAAPQPGRQRCSCA